MHSTYHEYIGSDLDLRIDWEWRLVVTCVDRIVGKGFAQGMKHHLGDSHPNVNPNVDQSSKHTWETRYSVYTCILHTTPLSTKHRRSHASVSSTVVLVSIKHFSTYILMPASSIILYLVSQLLTFKPKGRSWGINVSVHCQSPRPMGWRESMWAIHGTCMM